MDAIIDFIRLIFSKLGEMPIITTCWSIGCLYIGAWIKHWLPFEKILFNKRVFIRFIPSLIGIAILGSLHCYIALFVILFGILWSLVLPLPHEYYLLYLYKKKKVNISRYLMFIVSTPALIKYHKLNKVYDRTLFNKQEKDYHYWKSLKSLNLFPWEINRYYVDSLVVLHEIGAFKTLTEELVSIKEIAGLNYMYKLIEINLAQDNFDYNRAQDILKELENQECNNDRHLMNIYIGLSLQYDISGEKENYYHYEKKIIELAEKTCNMELNVLQNMMTYYDSINDNKSADNLISKIKQLKFRNIELKFKYYDIIYRHYQANDNRVERINLIDGLMNDIEHMATDDEEKIMSKIRMLRLYFENNYGWKEYSIDLFKMAEPIMAKSMNVAMTFMQEIRLLFSQSHSIMGLNLDSNYQELVMKKILGGMACYEDEMEQCIANTPDDFLYKKRSLLMMKADKTFFETNVRFRIVENMDDRLRYIERIIELCDKNTQRREQLHFMNVYVDDILSCDKNMTHENKNLLPEWKEAREVYLVKRQYYINKAIAMMGKIDNILDIKNYDLSLNYYVLYEAENYLKCNDLEHAKFFFNEFEKYNIVIEYFPLSTRQIYYQLKNFIRGGDGH